MENRKTAIFSIFFPFLLRPSTKLEQLQAIKIIQSRLGNDHTRSFDANRQFVPFRRRLCELQKFPQYPTPFTSHKFDFVHAYFR